jgi:hypothetical protein
MTPQEARAALDALVLSVSPPIGFFYLSLMAALVFAILSESATLLLLCLVVGYGCGESLKRRIEPIAEEIARLRERASHG